jgi:hypothetical protein
LAASFLPAANTICKQLMFGENFSRTAKLMLAPSVERRMPFDVFSNSTRDFPSLVTNKPRHKQASPQSGLRPEMSLEFEYRRLAAACLDLAKRADVFADKTRLILIAEAWLNLAGRVAPKGGKRRNGDAAEDALVPSTSGVSETMGGPNNSASAGRHSGTADGPACS